MFSQNPVAIIDIGSNSVRLVVYSGATRIPSIIFNEKVMAGLGRVGEDRELTADSQERALSALRRFRLLTGEMGVTRTRVVATAAVREASNGQEFLDKVREIGFSPDVLSGEEEGRMAGQGVISSIPKADGIVGDLGGGSLELVDVSDGKVQRSASVRLGVLRLGPIIAKGEGALAKRVARALKETGFHKSGLKRPFYMVGGSWRAVARLDMLLTSHPLPITHQYAMAPDRPRQLQAAIDVLGKANPKGLTSISISRVPTLPGANLLLQAIADELKPSRLVVSSFGIREGLLYDDLDELTRRRDPLIEASREAGTGLGRFAQHGELLDRWIAPIFNDDADAARLRLAACLLADIAWAAHPDFRAERGVDMALHGNWVGIDGPGRVMLAQALFCNFGGGTDLPDPAVSALSNPKDLKRASHWGLAIRLAQRLSGGVAAALERSRLSCQRDTLRLEIGEADRALFGEPVDRRLKTLAAAIGKRPEFVIRS